MNSNQRIAMLESRLASLEAERRQDSPNGQDERAGRRVPSLRRWPVVAAVLVAAGAAVAQSAPPIPTFTALKFFSPGAPALAADVNGNLDLLRRGLEQKTGTLGQDAVVTTGSLTVPANRPSSISNVAVGGLGHDNAAWAGIGHRSANQGSTSPNYAVLQNQTGSATLLNAAAGGSVSTRIGNGAAELTVRSTGVTVADDLQVDGKLIEKGFELSCIEAAYYSGSLQGNPHCCRINVRTGETRCNTSTSGGGSTWSATSFAYPGLSATTAGRYHLSCVAGAPGANFPFCCRINGASGAVTCGRGNTYQMGNSGTVAVPF